MKKIKINDTFEIDLATLIDTRLLIQANSGGGKSWLIRRLLEQSHGQVQHIVIDLEGEFSSLREKYDYVLAGKGGDTPADVKSAALLAQRLLELNVSAIIDLYELDHFSRKHFVKLFLDSMVNAPKNLWHPCLVVIDEAHVFCPEKGQAESSGSVIDLATRGRKRGYCAVLATQRLSKLHKDAAAECNNKLIGRTGLDVDMKRASEELGFTTKEQYLSLRSLESGEFFAFGPAMSNEVKRVKVGSIQTSHPKAGSRILTAAPIPPTSNIREILGKLSDLPQEAEKEKQTIDALKEEIRQLKIQGRRGIEVENKVDQKKVDQTRREQEIQNKRLSDMTIYANVLRIRLKEVIDKVGSIKELDIPEQPDDTKNENGMVMFEPLKPSLEMEELHDQLKEHDKHILDTSTIPTITADLHLGIAERKIYSFLYMYPGKDFTKVQVGAITGYSPRSGSFNNSISKLSTLGLIKRNGAIVTLGREDTTLVVLGECTPAVWLSKLEVAPRRIYQILWDNPQEVFTKEEIADKTEYSVNSGSFNNAISKLNTIGLIEKQGKMIRLNPDILI